MKKLLYTILLQIVGPVTGFAIGLLALQNLNPINIVAIALYICLIVVQIKYEDRYLLVSYSLIIFIIVSLCIGVTI